MAELRYPHINDDARPEEQIRQIKSYLYQLIEELNYNLGELEKQMKENKQNKNGRQ